MSIEDIALYVSINGEEALPVRSLAFDTDEETGKTRIILSNVEQPDEVRYGDPVAAGTPDTGYAAELKELMDAVMEYNSDRDAEWDFADKHGLDASGWTKEQVKEHDQILADIARNRECIRGILRRVTGDVTLEF